MEQKLYEKLMTAASFLHWLGKYDESNAMFLVARLMQGKGIEKIDQWENFVIRCEVVEVKPK